MKLKIVVHEAEEGGFWAEVPAIPGCSTEGDTFEQLLQNLYEAVEGCLSVEIEAVDATDRIIEIALAGEPAAAVWDRQPRDARVASGAAAEEEGICRIGG